jgi:transposase
VSKPYSMAFKQRMVQRLTGVNATSATKLAREIGVSQQNLSRWLGEARSLPGVAADKPKQKARTVEQKARAVAEAASLDGAALTAYLEREGITNGEIERWRLALDDREVASGAMTKRIRNLERELARKEKALAEAATLLILKKKVDAIFAEAEDVDPGDESEK